MYLKPYTCTTGTVQIIAFFSYKFYNIQFIDKMLMFINSNNWQLAVQIIMIVCCY